MQGLIKRLDWDSQFFGFEVGVAYSFPNNFNSLDVKNLFRLIYFLINPTDEKSRLNAQKHGAVLMDTKVTYALNIDNIETPAITFIPDNKVIEYNEKTVHSALYDLAFQSGEFSRFKKDEKLPKGSFLRMYSHWIERSVSGDIACKIFVIKTDNNIVAFATLSIENSKAKIGLFAVDKNFQGRKLGKNLMNYIILFCKKQKLAILEVPTQKENIGACKFYESIGFKMSESLLIYHFWI